MAKYIKARPKVAEFLNVATIRYKTFDGNYILWQNDLRPLGSPRKLDKILPMIGGVAMTDVDAVKERKGTLIHELPTPTDPRFMDEVATEEEVEEEQIEATTTEDTETETEAESTDNDNATEEE